LTQSENYSLSSKRKRSNSVQENETDVKNKPPKIKNETKANKKIKVDAEITVNTDVMKPNTEGKNEEKYATKGASQNLKSKKKDTDITLSEKTKENNLLTEKVIGAPKQTTKVKAKTKTQFEEAVLTQTEIQNEHVPEENLKNDEGISDVVYDISKFSPKLSKEFIAIAEELKQYRISHKEERNKLKDVLIRLKSLILKVPDNDAILVLFDSLRGATTGKIRKEMLKIQFQLSNSLQHSSESNKSLNITKSKKSQEALNGVPRALEDTDFYPKTSQDYKTKVNPVNSLLEFAEASEGTLQNKPKKTIGKKKRN